MMRICLSRQFFAARQTMTQLGIVIRTLAGQVPERSYATMSRAHRRGLAQKAYLQLQVSDTTHSPNAVTRAGPSSGVSSNTRRPTVHSGAVVAVDLPHTSLVGSRDGSSSVDGRRTPSPFACHAAGTPTTRASTLQTTSGPHGIGTLPGCRANRGVARHAAGSDEVLAVGQRPSGIQTFRST